MEMRHPSVVAEEYIVDPNLFERKDVMKDIVGPILDDFLRSSYEQEINDDETQCFLDSNSTMHPYLQSFVSSAWDLMLYRTCRKRKHDGGIRLLQDMNEASSPPLVHYKGLSKNIDRAKQSLFYYPKMKRVIEEGTRSGVVAPTSVAKQIVSIERLGDEDQEAFRRFSLEEVESIQEVLCRSETDKILIALTKGPNGFLGVGSTMVAERHDTSFFSFGIDYKDAYRTKDGKVVGLSDKYYIAAEEQRDQLRNAGDRGSLSTSGCPVRHRFEDEAGEKQEPLVITAKNFVTRALEVAKDQAIY